MKLLNIKNAHVIAMGIFAALMITFSIIGGVQHYSPIPFWDMWNGTLEFYAKVQAGDYAAWWQPHNEHWVLLSHLLFWLDYTFFGGASYFLIIVNYLLVILAATIFWYFLRHSKQNYSEDKSEIALVLFITGCLFSWIQENNLTWGFQGQFFLAQTLPLWALFWLAKSAERQSEKIPFFVACLLGVLSVGTMANGIFILPLMALYSVLLRQGIKKIVFLLILSGLMIGLFFYHFNYAGAVNNPNSIDVLKNNLFGVLKYTFIYLGNPLYYVDQSNLGRVIAGLAGLVLSVGSIWLFLINFPNRKKLCKQMALLFFIIYIGGTAFSSAIVRGPLDGAFSSRYTTPVLMAWAAFFILLYFNFNFLSMKLIIKRAICTTMLCLCTLAMVYQFRAVSLPAGYHSGKNVAALALALDIKDKSWVEFTVFPFVDWALNIARIAVEKHYSVFGSYPYIDLKKQMAQPYMAPLPKNSCLGKIEETQFIQDVDDYIRVAGWLFNHSQYNFSGPELVRFTDQNGIIIGFALTGTLKPYLSESIVKKSMTTGFNGYLKKTSTGPIMVIGDRSDCYFRVNTLPEARIVPK